MAIPVPVLSIVVLGILITIIAIVIVVFQRLQRLQGVGLPVELYITRSGMSRAPASIAGMVLLRWKGGDVYVWPGLEGIDETGVPNGGDQL